MAGFSDKPQERLTRIADAAIDAAAKTAEACDTDAAIMLVTDGKEVGVCMTGFGDMDDVLHLLLRAATAMGEASGIDVQVMPVSPN